MGRQSLYKARVRQASPAGPPVSIRGVHSMAGMTQGPPGSSAEDAFPGTCLPAVPGGRPGAPEDGLIRSLSTVGGVTPHRVAPLVLTFQAGPRSLVTLVEEGNHANARRSHRLRHWNRLP